MVEDIMVSTVSQSNLRLLENIWKGSLERPQLFFLTSGIGWCQIQRHCQDRKCWASLENVLIISALFIRDIWRAWWGIIFPFGNVSQNAADRKSTEGSLSLEADPGALNSLPFATQPSLPPLHLLSTSNALGPESTNSSRSASRSHFAHARNFFPSTMQTRLYPLPRVFPAIVHGFGECCLFSSRPFHTTRLPLPTI